MLFATRILLLFALVCKSTSVVAQFSGVFSKTPPLLAISQSAYFNGTSSYLTITPPAADTTKFTFAGWVRPTDASTNRMIFNASLDSTHHTYVMVTSACTCISFVHQADSANLYRAWSSTTITLNQWIHVVVAVDTSAATAASRVRIWINGIAQTLDYRDISNNPGVVIPQNTILYIGQNVVHAFGVKYAGLGAYYAGQLAEAYYINGQVLGPEAFVRPTASGLRSIAYAGPRTSSAWMRFISGSLHVNSFTDSFGDFSNNNVTDSTQKPY